MWGRSKISYTNSEELSNLFVVWDNLTAAIPWKQADGRGCCAILLYLQLYQTIAVDKCDEDPKSSIHCMFLRSHKVKACRARLVCRPSPIICNCGHKDSLQFETNHVNMSVILTMDLKGKCIWLWYSWIFVSMWPCEVAYTLGSCLVVPIVGALYATCPLGRE